MIVSESTFTSNRVSYSSGGIAGTIFVMVSSNSNTAISNCTFVANEAPISSAVLSGGS